MLNQEIEDYIKKDDDSLFLELPHWKLTEQKQTIFNLCTQYNAQKCLDKYVQTIGFDIDILINNKNLSIQEFKELFTLDKDFILDGDFDRSDKLLLALKAKNINAFTYLYDNFMHEYNEILGFSYEEAYSKSNEFIGHTTAYYAINFGIPCIIEKMSSLYENALNKLKISISATQSEVKKHNCDSDVNNLNELLFYDNLFKKGLSKMQESLKPADALA
jgi:hypothetical protein